MTPFLNFSAGNTTKLFGDIASRYTLPLQTLAARRAASFGLQLNCVATAVCQLSSRAVLLLLFLQHQIALDWGSGSYVISGSCCFLLNIRCLCRATAWMAAPSRAVSRPATSSGPDVAEVRAVVSQLVAYVASTGAVAQSRPLLQELDVRTRRPPSRCQATPHNNRSIVWMTDVPDKVLGSGSPPQARAEEQSLAAKLRSCRP